MRLRITLQPGRPTTIALNYGHQLASAVYRFLAESDADYAAFLHTEGYAPGLIPAGAQVGSGGVPSNGMPATFGPMPGGEPYATGMPRRFKLFTFSQLRAERSRVQGDRLQLLPGAVHWLITSPVEKFVREFASGLLARGLLQIGPHELPIAGVETLPPPEFTGVMRFTCLSPIVASVTEELDGKRWARYLRPKDPAFSERIRQNLLAKHCALHGHLPADQTLTVQFDTDYLARHRGTKLITHKGIHIIGVVCPLTLTGSIELIQIAYECGLGEKNSAGFGMIEVKKCN